MTAHQQAQDLLDFIDASPSPWHAAANMEQRLKAFDFQRLTEHEPWTLARGGRYYVVRDDSSLVIFVVGIKPLVETGFKILGAHTDSPGLRVKPTPSLHNDSLIRLAVEIYGGPILATFTDRDLSLAGRIAYENPDGSIAGCLLKVDAPLLRLPNLAIHMNRAVNEDGLKLHKQNELSAIISSTVEQTLPTDYFQTLLQQYSGIASERILSWELNLYDTQSGAFWGAEQEFYANSQLDNLASCHAGLTALLHDTTLSSETTLVCAFFDHEEIGSETAKGAAGSFLADVLQRISAAIDNDTDAYHRTLANSFMISADMAHAYQPNFPAAYEPNHKILMNHGPVIKSNVNQRYATECRSEAHFIRYCKMAGVAYQKYAHRGDLPCGSTIGPLASAKLGIRTVDVGNPMWAMHSIRESAGVFDHHALIRVLNCFFRD